MKVYYNDEEFKIIDSSGNKTAYGKINQIPNYENSITEIEIEDGTTGIYDSDFAYCESLEKITIPNTVKIIEDTAFLNCESLKSITIPDSVTKIGYGAFENCYSLETIILPKNMTKINNAIFRCCHSLKSVKLPDSITEIPSQMFYDCESLTEITIPENVKEIEKYAFYECSSLADITFEGNPDIKIHYEAFTYLDSLYPDVKEKLFYQIAKNIQEYEILDFFGEYNVEYNSELIQELISINIRFFNAAHKIDKEVFLDAALDSINSIEKKHDFIIIKTDLCNIIKNVLNSYDLVSNGISLIDNKFVEKYNSKIDEKIKEYLKKGEIER